VLNQTGRNEVEDCYGVSRREKKEEKRDGLEDRISWETGETSEVISNDLLLFRLSISTTTIFIKWGR